MRTLKNKNFVIFPATILLFLSISTVIYGYFHQSLDKVPKWQSDILVQFLYVFVCIISFIFFINKNRAFNLKKVSALLCLIVSLFILGLNETITLTIFICSATLYGEKVRKLLPYSGGSSEISSIYEIIISFAVGIVFLMFLLGISAHFKINYYSSHLILYLIPFFFKQERNQIFSYLYHDFLKNKVNLTKTQIYSTSYFYTLVFIYLLYASLPETFHDAISVYLPICEYLKSQSIWHFDPNKAVFGTMSFAAVWLEASVYRFGGDICAKMICFVTTILTSFLVYEILVREKVSKSIALFCSSLMLSTSAIFLISVSMFYDSQLMFIITSIFYLITKKNKNLEISTIILLCSSAIAIKISSVFPVFAFIAFGLFRTYREKIKITSNIVIPILLGLAIALPAYIFSYIKTGNPFFPFMNAVFKSTLIGEENIITPLSGKLSLKILYDMTFKSDEYFESYKGGFGFHFLLFLPFVFWISFFNRKNLLVIFSLIFIPLALLQLKLDHNIRYTTQFMPIYICLCGLIISKTSEYSKILYQFLQFLLVIVILMNTYFLASSTGPLRNTSLYTSINFKELENFKKNFVSQNTIAKKVVANFPTRPVLLSLNAGGLGAVDAELRYYNWYNSKLFNSLANSSKYSEIDKVLKEWGITHIIERQDNQYHNRDILHSYLEQNSDSKISYGSNIAYRLKDDLVLSKEYSINSNFDSKVDSWELSQVETVSNPITAAKILPGGYISQNFPSNGRKLFKLQIDFICTNKPQIMTTSVSFINKEGIMYSGDRWDTLCESEQKIERFEREFASPAETTHIRLAAGSFNKIIKFDSIELIGSEKAFE